MLLNPIFADDAAGAGIGVGIIILVVMSLLFYFLPSFVAVGKKKTNTGAIFALNLLLGWTLIGWVVSLVWALTQDAPPPQQVVVYQQASIPTTTPAQALPREPQTPSEP